MWCSLTDFLLKSYSHCTENKMKVTLFVESLSFSFSSVAPLIILLLPFLYSKEITFHWLFFFFPSCHEIHKFLCTEIQKARIQNQLCELLSWSSFWMTHSLWALCQLLSELCASKTAGPVLTHAKSRNSWMFADHRAHTNKPRVDAVPPKCCLMEPWLPGQSACVIQKSMNSGL